MSQSRREGPTFMAWLSGRFTSPPATGRCSSCGNRGADPDVVQELSAAGMKDAATFAALCDPCRRKERDRRLMQSIAGKP